MRADTDTARKFAVKDLIDELEAKFKSLREAAVTVGTSHQNLSNWRKGSPKQIEFIETFERIRKQLGISEKAMWRRMLGKK